MPREPTQAPLGGFAPGSGVRHAYATVAASLVLALSFFCLSQGADRTFPTQSAVLWQPYQSWDLTLPDHAGNPFDVVATVSFSHEATGALHRTEMFYLGDDRWSFRFTGTRTGAWRFVTESEHADLDGWRGQVWVDPNPAPAAAGFLAARGTRFVTPTDESGNVRARLYNVYLNAHSNDKEKLSDYDTDPRALAVEAEAILDEVEAHGLDALFVALNNNWFSFGSDRHRDHDSTDPSLTSFFVLETLILHAHARGLSVHVWAWGDEERSWTPIGVGGINGEADRRLQRYIAARLGPLPGWTMSYGFDLDEWVTPAETRAWHDYLHAHLGWPHLLMARETPSDVHPPARTFDLGADKLDVFSSDDRPEASFYAAAAAAIEASDAPVLFERRFVYLRDDVWDMDTTRRALWQFTLAGGVGAIWGPSWTDGTAYPEPEQMRTHARFWRDRWSLDLEPLGGGVDPAEAYILRDEAGARTIVYAQSTDSVPLDLAHMDGPHRAVAVDTLAPYNEIAIGELEAAQGIWQAPYASDWAIAVGAF